MKIGNREIGEKTFIIAEAGVGFVGPNPPHARDIIGERLSRALNYVDAAYQADADAVKFQMFVPDEKLFCPLRGDRKRWKLWKQSFLTFDEWRLVKRLCDDIGIIFLASVFQPTAIEWLKELKVEAYKVASRAAMTMTAR